MKKFKQLFAVLLIILFLFTFMPLSAFAENISKIDVNIKSEDNSVKDDINLNNKEVNVEENLEGRNDKDAKDNKNLNNDKSSNNDSSQKNLSNLNIKADKNKINELLNKKDVKPRVKKGEAIIYYETTEEKALSGKDKSIFSSENDINIKKSWDFTKFEKNKSTKGVLGNNNIKHNMVSLVTSKKYSTKQLISKLKSNKKIKYAAPNRIVHKYDINGLNDKYKDYQWSLKNSGQNGGAVNKDIGIESLNSSWPSTANTDEKVVAIIDTGIDYTNEDLKDVLWNNNTGLKGKYGYDFANGDVDPLDDDGHGSHCAGIIAAQSNNNKGISGISNVKIMSLKFLDADGDGEISDAISAYYYIYEAMSKYGVNVVAINNSWGSEVESKDELNIFAQIMNMVGSKGSLSVCASGNDGINMDKSIYVPASANSKYNIVVGSSNEKGELSSFSNYGESSVDIAAPGNDILSTVSYANYNPSLYLDDNNINNMVNTFESAPKFKIFDNNGDEVSSLGTVSEERYLGANKGKSLKLTIKDANSLEPYTIVFPYNAKASSSTLGYEYNSAMIASNTDKQGIVVTKNVKLSGTSADDFKYTPSIFISDLMNIDETSLTVIEPEMDDYWTSISSKNTNSKDGELRGIAIQLIPVESGDYVFYIDNVGVSNPCKDDDMSNNFGKYDYYSGTSMAAPQICGSIALLREQTYIKEPLTRKKNVISMTSNLVDRLNTDGNKIDIRSGTVDFRKINTLNPYIDTATYKSPNIVIKGFSFGSEKGKLFVNDHEKNVISWKDKEIIINASGMKNKSAVIKIIKNDDTYAKKGIYLSSAIKYPAKTKILLDDIMDEESADSDIISDGKYLYVYDDEYYMYKYDSEEKEFIEIGPERKYNSSNNNDDYEEQDGPSNNPALVALFKSVISKDPKAGVILSSEGIYLNGSFYFIANYTTGYKDIQRIVRFNVKNEKWYNVVSLPNNINKYVDHALGLYKGNLYVIGGYNETDNMASNLVSVYNITTKKWSNAAKIPTGRYKAKARQSGNKLVLLLGGEIGNTKCPNILNFDGTKWTENKQLINPTEDYKAYIMPNFDFEDVLNGGDIPDPKAVYYDAAVGINKAGISIAGLYAEGFGDIYNYDVNKNILTNSSYKMFDNPNKEIYDVAGTSVGSKFYLVDLYNDTSFCLRSISISSGNLMVSNKAKPKYGKISGFGSYLPGNTVTLYPKANKNYYVYKNSFKVNSKIYKGNKYSFIVNSDTKISANAKFNAYVTKIKLNKKTIKNAKVGKKYKLKAKVYPTNSFNKKVIYKSSNKKYATVTSKGIVKIKKAGRGKKVKIYAIAKDRNNIKTYCLIKIKK